MSARVRHRSGAVRECCRMRHLLPRLFTMTQRWSSRSISAAAIVSSPKTTLHSSKPFSSALWIPARTADS